MHGHFIVTSKVQWVRWRVGWQNHHVNSLNIFLLIQPVQTYSSLFSTACLGDKLAMCLRVWLSNFPHLFNIHKWMLGVDNSKHRVTLRNNFMEYFTIVFIEVPTVSLHYLYATPYRKCWMLGENSLLLLISWWTVVIF